MYLTNSIIFCDKVVTCLAYVGLLAGTVYLDFSKALTVVFHSLPLEKLVCWALEKGSLQWVGSWLAGSSRVGISSSFSNQQPVPSEVPLGYWGQHFSIFISVLEDGIKCTLVKTADDTNSGKVDT